MSSSEARLGRSERFSLWLHRGWARESLRPVLWPAKVVLSVFAVVLSAVTGATAGELWNLGGLAYAVWAVMLVVGVLVGVWCGVWLLGRMQVPRAWGSCPDGEVLDMVKRSRRTWAELDQMSNPAQIVTDSEQLLILADVCSIPGLRDAVLAFWSSEPYGGKRSDVFWTWQRIVIGAILKRYTGYDFDDSWSTVVRFLDNGKNH